MATTDDGNLSVNAPLAVKLVPVEYSRVLDVRSDNRISHCEYDSPGSYRPVDPRYSELSAPEFVDGGDGIHHMCILEVVDADGMS